MKENDFQKKYGIPHTRTFNGKSYVISAATKWGVPKGDAEYNKKYLTDMGFKVRTVKKGNDYFVYGFKI